MHVSDEEPESQIHLTYEQSKKFAEVMQQSTVDAQGRTYLERMRERAERAAQEAGE